jgi:hypothetical protein
VSDEFQEVILGHGEISIWEQNVYVPGLGRSVEIPGLLVSWEEGKRASGLSPRLHARRERGGGARRRPEKVQKTVEALTRSRSIQKGPERALITREPSMYLNQRLVLLGFAPVWSVRFVEPTVDISQSCALAGTL